MGIAMSSAVAILILTSLSSWLYKTRKKKAKRSPKHDQGGASRADTCTLYGLENVKAELDGQHNRKFELSTEANAVELDSRAVLAELGDTYGARCDSDGVTATTNITLH